MYKILIDSFPIGQVRFEINLDKAIIDYSISRQFRGRKLGIRLLDEAINKFEENYNNTIIGKVKPENYVSSKIFKSLGFSMNTIDNVRVYTKRTFRGDYVK